MKHSDARSLMAATIYASFRMQRHDGLRALMEDALAEADELLAIAAGTPADPEAEPEPELEQPARGDPFFVIHRETSRAISSPREECPPVPRNMMLTQGVGSAIEEIDSAIFSGDTFNSDLVAIEYLEWHIGRWVREISRNRRVLEDEIKPVAPHVAVVNAGGKRCGICRSTDHSDDTCPNDIPF